MDSASSSQGKEFFSWDAQSICALSQRHKRTAIFLKCKSIQTLHLSNPRAQHLISLKNLSWQRQQKSKLWNRNKLLAATKQQGPWKRNTRKMNEGVSEKSNINNARTWRENQTVVDVETGFLPSLAQLYSIEHCLPMYQLPWFSCSILLCSLLVKLSQCTTQHKSHK